MAGQIRELPLFPFAAQMEAVAFLTASLFKS
jgi:hypothetical protein